MTGEPLPNPEEVVVITGVVRPVVKEDLEKYYNLKWDMEVQEKIEIENSSIPVLIADSITITSQE